MKKILALTLAALLLLSCAACGTQKADLTEPTTEPTTEATEPTTAAASDRTATYIQLTIYEEDDSFVSIAAYVQARAREGSRREHLR